MPTEQNRAEEAQPRPACAAALLRRLLAFAGCAMLATAVLLGSYVTLRYLGEDGHACEESDDPTPLGGNPPHGPKLFVGWGQPELALVVSGQMHGYMLPCGCSPIQHGGLVRRLAFINELKAKGWDVIGVDLGELPPKLGEGIPRQRELKLEYTMKALDAMGYRAVGIGKTEMAMPLIDAMSQYSVNKAVPRPLNATLEITKPKNRVYHALNVRPYEILPGNPKIGVASMIGPGLEDVFEADKAMEFRNNLVQVMPELQKAFVKEKVEIAMLLHHEYPKGAVGPLAIDRDRRAMAVAIARQWEAARRNNPQIPPLQLLMVLTQEPEPPAMLQAVPGTPTHIVEIGHKGKYVGVVGIYRRGSEVQLKYDIVKMEPKYQPKEGQANKVLDLLEAYAKHVKDDDLLRKADYLRSPHPIQVDEYVKKTYGGSTFVGTARCLRCHKAEGKVWQASDHHKAFETLVEKKNPSLRQYDPECVVCHTVGFKHPDGYNVLRREDWVELRQQKAGAAQIKAAIAVRNAKLENVGCESCHGPGSAHANGNTNDAKLYPLINPYRPTQTERDLAVKIANAANAQARLAAAAAAKRAFERRMQRLDGDFCQKCHNEENDNRWTELPFLEKWMHIMHNDPNNVGNRWLPPRPAKVVPVNR